MQEGHGRLSAVLTALVAVLGALLLPAPARADEPRPGLLRIAHLSPDTPAVDVSLTAVAEPGQVLTDPGPVVAPAVAYGDVTAYREVPPGSRAVSVRGVGSPTAPVLSTRVEVAPGQVRTVVLGGAFADLALSVTEDDLAPPPAGSARVRVLAATTRPSVDVSITGGPALATSLRPGEVGDPVTVPGGRYGASVTGGSDDVPLDLAAGSVVTILVLDPPGSGTTLRPVVDATGPAVRPVGGVDAGGGPRLPGSALTGTIATLSAAGSAAVHRRDESAAPARLRLPSVGVDAVLAGTGLDGGGALVVPADARTAGWFTGGPRPGEPGPAVLTGHVDWAGRPGALSGLRSAAVGADVLVDRVDGTVARFRITAVERYAKDAFPAERVYAPTPAAELRLITCGGPFDRERGSYRDNVVVSAVLAG
ncbi:class F sortase [Blastococcus atacamensis]|uniref:class F sortase n=1 Tax=Blastococcus atacamensis TaxID=2070508 RepID=UPI000CEC5061|nr:class F sortase [Blastococcus atacamensis]